MLSSEFGDAAIT
ncbi:putative membrane protein, partial [Yersinia pestis PY-113]